MVKISYLRLPPCRKQFATMRRMHRIQPLPVLSKVRFQTHHRDSPGALETGSHPFDVSHSTGHHVSPCESTRVAVGGVLENHPLALESAIRTLPLTGLPSNRHVHEYLPSCLRNSYLLSTTGVSHSTSVSTGVYAAAFSVM